LSVALAADALRVLPYPGVSVAEIHDETSGESLLDLTATAHADSGAAHATVPDRPPPDAL
ncbi:MAG: hypothetical protein ACLPV4_03310, partial [Solirubrobacteraceae bacterium]